MCYSQQQIYNDAAYGGEDSPPSWIEEDAERCGCRGSGWYLSQVDTYHQCPVHYHGQKHPEVAAAEYEGWINCHEWQATLKFEHCPTCKNKAECDKANAPSKPIKVVTEDAHRITYSRKSGRDGWTLKCSCGRSWHGWRWLCEERYNEHKY